MEGSLVDHLAPGTQMGFASLRDGQTALNAEPWLFQCSGVFNGLNRSDHFQSLELVQCWRQCEVLRFCSGSNREFDMLRPGIPAGRKQSLETW